MSRRLLLVLAHPDDESMGNGALVVRHAGAGVEVHLVCATRGGAGWNDRPAGRRPDELPAIRTEELGRAAAVLGLAGHQLWDYPDGGVAAADQEEISDRIRRVVDDLDPDAIVGWGPDGGYGHPDHIAVGACTDRALAGSGRALYHMALDQPAVDGWRTAMAQSGSDEGSWQLKATPRVDVVIEPTPAELRTVKRAIECHDSQRNKVTEIMVGNDANLFWMARSCYLRVTGGIRPPATDLLPELAAAGE